MKLLTRITSSMTIGLAVAVIVVQAGAGEERRDETLLKSLSKSKLTLAQGIQQAAKSPGVPISAKFEMDHSGQLALSVYVADKGVGADAEHNVLTELIGSPESAAWTPQREVFKDVEHVARSAEQLTLLRLSSKSLADIVKLAERSGGAVFSITPTIEDHKGGFEVLVYKDGKATELMYDLDGKPLADEDDEDKKH